MAFHKPCDWDRAKALHVAMSNSGRVTVDWRWRMDQRRGVCKRAAKDGLLRHLRFQIVTHDDGRRERFKMPPGADTFEITDAGKQWLRDNSPKKD